MLNAFFMPIKHIGNTIH